MIIHAVVGCVLGDQQLHLDLAAAALPPASRGSQRSSLLAAKGSKHFILCKQGQTVNRKLVTDKKRDGQKYNNILIIRTNTERRTEREKTKSTL